MRLGKWIMPVLGCAVTLSFAGLANASNLININFDDGTVGNTVPTAPYVVGASPVTDVTALGGYTSDPLTPANGWPYPHAGMGTLNVADVGTLSKAAVMASDSTDAEVGALYMDTTLGFQAQQFHWSFDVNVQNQAATGYGQTKIDADTAATDNLLLGTRFYSSSAGQFGPTFQLIADSTTGGRFGFRNDPTNTLVKTFGSYTVGDTHHLDIDVDYTTGLLSASVDSTPLLTNYAFWPSGTSNNNISELFTYLNGSSGTSNQVALDNIQVTTVPEPSAIWAGSAIMAALGLFKLRRRRALATVAA